MPINDGTRHMNFLEQHRQFITNFANNKSKLPAQKTELISLKQKVTEMNAITDTELGPLKINERFKLMNRIKILEKEINKVHKEKQNYLVKSKSALSQFQSLSKNAYSENNLNGLLNEYKRKLGLDQDIKISGKDNEMYCNVCNDAMDHDQQDDMFICHTCGIVKDSFSVQENKNVQKSKKISHFNDWLDQLQARGIIVPEDVYEQVSAHLKSLRFNNMSELNYDFMRNIFKKLKLNKFYDQIPVIINRLNNRSNDTIDYETEEKLKQMFQMIQAPYYQVKPKNRKSFLSYGFVLHKLCYLLDRKDIVSGYTLLKSRTKLREQEKIWKDMMQILGWDFIPTIL